MTVQLPLSSPFLPLFLSLSCHERTERNFATFSSPSVGVTCVAGERSLDVSQLLEPDFLSCFVSRVGLFTPSLSLVSRQEDLHSGAARALDRSNQLQSTVFMTSIDWISCVFCSTSRDKRLAAIDCRRSMSLLLSASSSPSYSIACE